MTVLGAGKHMETGTAKGADSWRRHQNSDRHMDWFENVFMKNL